MKGKTINKKIPILIFALTTIPLLLIAIYFNFSLKDQPIVEEPDEQEEYEIDTQPVINETTTIIQPYYQENVTIGKKYYDYKGDESSQEQSLNRKDNTYYQNTGIDYVSENTFDVVTILNGEVINIKEDDQVGKTIEIKHQNGIISIYQSLSEIAVNKGDIVYQGQLIGKSGTNQMDEELGNHLHLEILENGNPVNPENYMNKTIEKKN